MDCPRRIFRIGSYENRTDRARLDGLSLRLSAARFYNNNMYLTRYTVQRTKNPIAIAIPTIDLESTGNTPPGLKCYMSTHLGYHRVLRCIRKQDDPEEPFQSMRAIPHQAPQMHSEV
ncbi:hypothetical protein RvY_04581 [Ramazzottius varieornatus]|uniref:Uncharacterized protein n=1 Tax=Ramazzottius varieornatus TaxID=947166 RepID=A0A1D1US29_RAMVA|nr:hypothetical protein RvY_04581 [Ramazzottius varieornatus]